jgi:ADP-ribosyl-[dinitrogen reductase] hydrolase
MVSLVAIKHIKPDQMPHGNGSGYVADALHSARLALQESSYQSVIKAAIALGNDTDTTARIAGGIAGIRYGVQAIPSEWMNLLREKETPQQLLTRLLQYLRFM